MEWFSIRIDVEDANGAYPMYPEDTFGTEKEAVAYSILYMLRYNIIPIDAKIEYWHNTDGIRFISDNEEQKLYATVYITTIIE